MPLMSRYFHQVIASYGPTEPLRRFKDLWQSDDGSEEAFKRICEAIKLGKRTYTTPQRQTPLFTTYRRSSSDDDIASGAYWGKMFGWW